jgi:hypothetical protein
MWIGAPLGKQAANDPKDVSPRLFEFDPDRGSVEEHPLHGDKISPDSNVKGFDAHYVFTGTCLIDRSNGRVLQTPFMRCVGMREGRIYSMSESAEATELVRVPVGSLTDTSVLYRFTDDSLRRVPSKHGAVLFGENATYVWDGKRWVELQESKQ